MTNLRGFKQKLAVVSRFWDEGDYDRALAEVEALLAVWPGNAHLHVLWANLVQLQENPHHDLDEARKALLLAVEFDKSSPSASIELGHFLDGVADDPQSAFKAYSEGVANARQQLIEGLIGQAKALRQLDRKEECLRCVMEVLHLTQAEPTAKRNKEAESHRAEQIRELLDGALPVRLEAGSRVQA